MTKDTKTSETYFIRGTIAIYFASDELKIYLTPCSDFIMPGNTKKAIAFLAPAENADEGAAKNSGSSSLPEIARIIELTDGKKDFNAEKIKEHISSLVAIAAQQKNVELRLKCVEEKCSEMKIVGFVFPAP